MTKTNKPSWWDKEPTPEQVARERKFEQTVEGASDADLEEGLGKTNATAVKRLEARNAIERQLSGARGR